MSTDRVRTRTARPASSRSFSDASHAERRRTCWGDGTQYRDYVYVADVLAATLAAAEARPGVVNVGIGTATSVLDLLDACLRVAGVEIEPVFNPPRPGELQRSVLDPGLAEQALDVRATTTFDDGITATWESMRARKD